MGFVARCGGGGLRRLTRSQSQARTRERLLQAAREAFLRDGFARTSVESIAEAAGLSKGAVYSNFEGKDELFLELLEAKFAADSEEIGRLAATHGDREKLRDAIQRHLEAHGDILDFTAVAVEFLSQIESGSAVARRTAELYEAQRRTTAGLAALASGRAAGDSRLQDFAAGLIALTLGLATQRSLDRRAVSVALWAQLVHDYLGALADG
jgi:TetR/AcrR family transcriptional regulator, transcriptional repressor of aconitase